MLEIGMEIAGVLRRIGEDRLFVLVAEAVDRLDAHGRSGVFERVVEHVVGRLAVAVRVVQQPDMVGYGPCVDVGVACHLAAQYVVFVDVDRPRGIPVPDVGYDLVGARLFETVFGTADEGVGGAVEADLELFVVTNRTVGPLLHAVAVDPVEAESDGRTLGADGRTRRMWCP